jgi:hypothetical protein
MLTTHSYFFFISKSRVDNVFIKDQMKSKRLARHKAKKNVIFELKRRSQQEIDDQREAVRKEHREDELAMMNEMAVCSKMNACPALFTASWHI